MGLSVTVESTEQLTTYAGRQVRVWEGKTPKGVDIVLYVIGVRIPDGQDSSELDAALVRRTAPMEQGGPIDTRLLT